MTHDRRKSAPGTPEQQGQQPDRQGAAEEEDTGMGVSSERDEHEVQEVGERARASQRPRTSQQDADQRSDERGGEWVDTDALAVDALDDQTRTHLDEPAETEDVQTNPGPVQHQNDEED